MSQSFADAGDVIMSRVVLELITQKLLCILHRRGMCRGDAGAAKICMAAAAAILTLLADLYREFKPAGQLARAAWMLNSTIVSDFTLAIMVLGLGLGQSQSQSRGADGDGDGDGDELTQGRVELLAQSLAICEDLGRKSGEAYRAAAALREMLRALQPQMWPDGGADVQADLVGMRGEKEEDMRDGAAWLAMGDRSPGIPGNVDWTFLDQYMYDANGAMPLTGLEGVFASPDRVC